MSDHLDGIVAPATDDGVRTEKGMGMNVGFVGLGNMGGPMAERILAAGFPLMVHDVRPVAGRSR